MLTLALLVLASAPVAPSDAELTAFGEAIAADLSGGRDAISPRFDFEGFFSRTLPGVPVTAPQKASFKKGFMGALEAAWVAQSAQSQDGTQFTYRRNVSIDEVRGVQLRVIYKDETYDFLEFAVAKDAHGELKVIDILDVGTGSLRSLDARLVLLALLSRKDTNVVKRFFSKEHPLLDQFPAIAQMNDATLKNQPATVVAIWKTMPQPARDHQISMRIYLNALIALDDEKALEEALLRFLDLFPNDPANQMRALNVFLIRKDWEASLASLAAVEKRVGNDAMFDLLRAEVNMSAGRPAEERKHLEAAVAREPTLAKAWLVLVDFGLSQRKWADVARWMSEAQRSAGLSFDLRAAKYAGFAGSTEGKAWASAHPR